jgi:hypothetical protein
MVYTKELQQERAATLAVRYALALKSPAYAGVMTKLFAEYPVAYGDAEVADELETLARYVVQYIEEQGPLTKPDYLPLTEHVQDTWDSFTHNYAHLTMVNWYYQKYDGDFEDLVIHHTWKVAENLLAEDRFDQDNPDWKLVAEKAVGAVCVALEVLPPALDQEFSKQLLGILQPGA